MGLCRSVRQLRNAVHSSSTIPLARARGSRIPQESSINETLARTFVDGPCPDVWADLWPSRIAAAHHHPRQLQACRREGLLLQKSITLAASSTIDILPTV